MYEELDTTMEGILDFVRNLIFSAEEEGVQNEDIQSDKSVSKDKEVMDMYPNRYRNGGRIGESRVDYELKWLGDGFISISKDCLDSYGNETILLQNEDFIDQELEYDHILVSRRNIYLIETKNFKGQISVTKNGCWVRTDSYGNQRGERSPIAQIDRHHKLLLNILGDQVRKSDVIDILCVAHDSAVIKGEENFPVPIVKVDVLNRFIEKMENRKKDRYDPEEIVELINDYKISYED